MSTTRPPRVSHPRLWGVAVALALVLAVALGLTLRPAAAAQLPLREARMTSVSIADRCTPIVSTTNGTVTGGRATTVLLTGLGTRCGGRVVALTLFGPNGAALTSGTTTLPASTSGSGTVIVGSYAPADIAGAAMTVGTWGVPATWTYTPPATVPPVSCTVLNDPTGTKTCAATDFEIGAWGYPQLDTNNIIFYVTSPSPATDVEWQVTINLADPMFKVYARLADGQNVRLAPGWSCSSMPMLVLRGRSDTGTQYVGGGNRAGVWLQGKATSGPTAGGNLFNCS